MIYEELLKEIEKHTWWSEEAPATIQSIASVFHCFIRQSEVFKTKIFKIVIILFNGDFIYERSPEDEKYKVYEYVFKEMKKDDNFLERCRKDFNEKAEICFKEASDFIKNKNKIGNKELANSYVRFTKKYLNYLPYAAAIECVDIFTAYYLEDIVKKEIKVSDDKLKDIIFVLSSFHELSFMEKERLDFLEICLKHFNDIKKNKITNGLKRELENHSKRYFYVLNNFKTTRYLDRDYFLNNAKKEIRNNKLQKEYDSLKNKINNLIKREKEIYDKYDISNNLKLHFKILKSLGGGIDNRKGHMIKTTYYLELYCEEIAKRFNLKRKELDNYTFEELKDFLLIGKRLRKDILKKRKMVSACVITKGKRDEINKTWFYGKQAKEILKRTSHKITKEIKGQVASSPVKKIEGKVQVILDISKQDFKKGNILVTTMTRPEFVPLMRKAKAIITDEGGLTSHAAILSREMKKVCVIGTKIATKVLKDGDLVEVDANKGIVRKIKSKS